VVEVEADGRGQRCRQGSGVESNVVCERTRTPVAIFRLSTQPCRVVLATLLAGAKLRSSESWKKAKMMKHVSTAVRQFNTLREVVDIAQKLDFREFKFVKRLGHGAFGEVSEYQVRNDVSTRVIRALVRAVLTPTRSPSTL